MNNALTTLTAHELALVARARAEHRGFTYLFPADHANQPTRNAPVGTERLERIASMAFASTAVVGLVLLVVAAGHLVTALTNAAGLF